MPVHAEPADDRLRYIANPGSGTVLFALKGRGKVAVCLMAAAHAVASMFDAANERSRQSLGF